MYATLLKNSLLSILIILIIHFLIKKQLLLPLPQRPRTALSEENQILAYISAMDESKANNKLQQIASTDEDLLRQSQTNQMKELYDFVYNDESSAAELGSYFQSLPKVDPSKTISCHPSDLRTDDRDSCGDAISMHIQSQKKKAVSENNLKYYKNAVGINEYPDENVINGGLIEGALTGFDNFSADYQMVN